MNLLEQNNIKPECPGYLKEIIDINPNGIFLFYKGPECRLSAWRLISQKDEKDFITKRLNNFANEVWGMDKWPSCHPDYPAYIIIFSLDLVFIL
jgi:hypothetical protein